MERIGLEPTGGVLTTVLADVAGTTTPAGQTRVYTYVTVQNRDGTADANFTLYVTNGTETLDFGPKNALVKAAGGHLFTEGPEIIMPAGWRFRGIASANDDVSITLFGYKIVSAP